MNIKVQCCGIILMLSILHFYVRQRKLKLNTGVAFFQLFMISFIGVMMDIISLIVLYYHEYLPGIMIDMICKSYVSMLILTALSGVLYICRDIYIQNTKYKKYSKVFSLIAAVGIILVFILPIYKSYDDPEHMFTYGPSVMLTYAFCVGFLLISIFYLIRRKRKMNILRWEAMRIWLVFWIGAAFIQFLYNELLLVGFAGAVGIMVLYLKLENPENFLDQKSGLFNKTAFLSYMKQSYGEEKNFSILGMILPHNNIDQDLVEYLLYIPESLVFRIEEDVILLLYQNKEIAEEHFTILKSQFDSGWGNREDAFIRPQWFFIPDTNVVDKAENLLYLIQHSRQGYNLQNKTENDPSGQNAARQNSNDHAMEDILWIDKTIVDSIYEEKRIEQLITSALNDDRVEVFYQPIYSIEEGRFVSAEALIRIYDEQGNIIPPAQFIEVAEKNGTIMKLGEIVFEKVCRFLRDDKPDQYGLHYIEVNLSVVQCAYEHLAYNFIEIMHAFQIDPKMINLEITESSSIGNRKQTLLNNMNCLIDYGVEFSLDDFGTGHSNLNYIVEMPVNIVKFDRSMIVSYFENGKAKYVMDAAMHMIQGMKLPIVSEGIETEEQLHTMKELGINYIQGYYFSKPLPKKDFLVFLSENMN